MSFLYVNNTDLSPYINSLTIDHEPIWNTDAGRTITARYVGRIIARKWKLNLTTKPLSQSESAKIGSLLKKGEFVTVKFINPDSATGAVKTTDMYVSPSSYSVYSYADEVSRARYKELAFNLIEQ